ncbi:hypothetical protein [Methylobacterium sp. A54F]
MTLRITATVALALFATAATAGETRTVTAWGHDFQVRTFGEPAAATIQAPARYAVLGRAPASRSSSEVVSGPVAQPADRTLNVWGARVSAPGH